MIKDDTISLISKKYKILESVLDERSRRLWAASEALVLGHGGIDLVMHATGLCRNTIKHGLDEISNKPPDKKDSPSLQRIRLSGGGRKEIENASPEIISALEELLEPSISGDPMSPLHWTCKSTRKLAEELRSQGFSVSHVTVVELLKKLDFTLQSNRKSKESSSQHPDRNAQFTLINETVKSFQMLEQPVISVDTKKKEIVGDFKNNGKEWYPKGQPLEVRGHDFPDKELGKAVPYGIYDIFSNIGFVNVGISHDTAEFAVNSIRTWWNTMGKESYSSASELLITADCGGSNGYRTRLWKTELQKFADETGLRINVCHFPPGTSKWNKIEHRMFSHISMNWRGKPLESLEAIVNLIGSTKNEKGLSIQSTLDKKFYEKGRKISDTEIAKLNIDRNIFHGNWNYSFVPALNPK
ncbi:MAG: ISAzo13 family transposase [Candidatus Riflebacteria bacterium]|nr:ISAzo13 family transposase [Candidatus Riflebacteria bacterium]